MEGTWIKISAKAFTIYIHRFFEKFDKNIEICEIFDYSYYVTIVQLMKGRIP